MSRQDASQSGPPTDAHPDANAAPSASARFVAGLTLGAFVGAAIAGSAIWDRRRRRRSDPAEARRAETDASD